MAKQLKNVDVYAIPEELDEMEQMIFLNGKIPLVDYVRIVINDAVANLPYDDYVLFVKSLFLALSRNKAKRPEQSKRRMIADLQMITGIALKKIQHNKRKLFPKTEGITMDDLVDFTADIIDTLESFNI